ncbi:hypothetical protein SHKM778_09640 [Streptomyces sp. KM77-8]|uniref:Putative restriction endonuclease domain-containing protein n=1 Tax=Streptomyces haneummycinicus TaxID=3074435 RepID=A0AAT9HAX3_9ACTN
MTALAEEVAPVVDKPVSEPGSDLDEVLWQAWKAMDLPEGYRAEIIEGAIEVSPTGRRRHGVLVNRLRRALDAHLGRSGYAAHQDVNVIHRQKAWIPDLFVAPSTSTRSRTRTVSASTPPESRWSSRSPRPVIATSSATASANAASTRGPGSRCT